MSEPRNRFSAEQVARLARLKLAPDQIDDVQNQMNRILDFVDQIEQLDLAEVEPFFGSVDSVNPLRDDAVKDGLTRQQALANAPDTDGEFYCVPPVFKK